jgi:small basic protein (TIGR04137 family)
MSLHKSLITKNRLVRRRNVLSREERMEKLRETGKLEEKDSVFGLPKVKVRKVRKRVKDKKKKEALEAAAEVVGTTEADEKAEPAKKKASDKK